MAVSGEPPAVLHDIIIIGAGTCGLAVAARLREQNPAAIFTDKEHNRLHWERRHGRKMALKGIKKERASTAADVTRSEHDMVVLDADFDTWMGRWNHLFQTFDIKHLRSPMFWHVDPNDRDSLLCKAYEQGRERELVEIKHCVGKEVSKHMKKRDSEIAINELDRKDYFNPSHALFRDHCDDLVGRYGLQGGLVRKERVLDISHAEVLGVSIAGEKLFTLRTDKGIRYATIVIVAVGPGNQAHMPGIPGIITTTPSSASAFPSAEAPTLSRQACHAMHIRKFPDAVVQRRILAGRRTNILVIGGGLTSAQLAHLAVRKGVDTVWHVMRGPLRIKPFDVDLAWMGKFQNAELSRFWQADSDDERLAFLRAARGGGSITPQYHQIWQGLSASGRWRMFEHTSLVGASFVEAVGGSGAWQVKTSPEVGGMPPMDYIYFATGVETNFATLPYLQTLLKSHPISGCGGFPCLNDNLMWKDGVPLFMAGRLAALKLGPSAANLGGARLAAERIARGVGELSRERCRLIPGSRGRRNRKEDEELVAYVAGTGNMFESLAEASS